jgi:deoxycytidylate deaminase
MAIADNHCPRSANYDAAVGAAGVDGCGILAVDENGRR